MILSISTTHRPATDLGYLLAKNPVRCQSFSLASGQAHVFYPVAREDRCTATLMLDLDPVGLVRGRGQRRPEAATLWQYVNDRPYVASSFLSVAIAQVYGSAMKGSSSERQELADTGIPLEAEIPVLPCHGGEEALRRLFEPLGYAVETRAIPLDGSFPEWGESPYLAVGLRAVVRLRDLMTHLYVLLPVLDNRKHYWVGQDEVEKLLDKGAGWLTGHPEREFIVNRYLKRRRRLVNEALSRLVADEDPDPEASEAVRTDEEDALEKDISLNEQRLGTVVSVLKNSGARRVVDLGCGEGRLLKSLLSEKGFAQIAGMDVSVRALELAKDRLNLDRMPPKQRERVSLFQGSLTYRDSRLEGYDAACAVEVVEHIDPSRLPAFERTVFEFARPQTVVITTPNVEYNVRWETLPAGEKRHRDHRFEWSRDEFRTWADSVCERFGYVVSYLPIGPDDPEVGPPTQMGVFTR